VGSVRVRKMREHVEVHLSSTRVDRPRVYAFGLGEPVHKLFDVIREDFGDPDLPLTLESIVGDEVSVVSPQIVHAYAWGTGSGRQLKVGSVVYPVAVVGERGIAAQELNLTPRKRHIAEASRDLSTKYVVVTGGVVSGIGKGVTASSIGMLIKAAGYRVTAVKIDPYINMDAGTMSPFEHGEVYVLDDGGEADLDLGNYERFMDLNLSRDNNITTGKIYQHILERERKGDYLGKTVQVVPHVTNTIQEWIERVAHAPADGRPGAPDVCVIELGGTVGDIESMPFIEALRQFQWKVGRDNVAFFHVSLVPVVGAVGEEKTKPTQHSVQSLRAMGISPDFLVCRSTRPLDDKTKEKLAMFCHVPEDQCVGMHDVSNIYRVPLLIEQAGTLDKLLARLEMPRHPTTVLDEWGSLAELVDHLSTPVNIAIVGKYTSLGDAYLSVTKALNHASYACERKLVLTWIEATALEPDMEKTDASGYMKAWSDLRAADGVLVPGGFGDRGVEGKILAANYARTNGVPFFGICLGFQVAVIEYARSVLGWQDAHSAEFDEKTRHPVVMFMPEISKTHMGGTMRLGLRRTVLQSNKCLAARLYGGVTLIEERHRHRYEVNPEYVQQFNHSGLEFVGQDVQGERMEIFELKGHRYYVGCQYHPEFKSRPNKPSPLFLGLLLAASKQPLP